MNGAFSASMTRCKKFGDSAPEVSLMVVEEGPFSNYRQMGK
jgi:hypothetical protein